ncbi:hypothetical protein ACHAXR_000933, partial [Thalassiosira sp. AJA248-18]
MVPFKIILLPLLAIGGCVESRPDDAVVCSAEQCEQAYRDMNFSGSFYLGVWPTKGCFSKNNNVFFGTGGTLEEMSETVLQGTLRKRIWCEKETEAPTVKPSKQPTANPTAKPVTDSPTKQPTKKPVTDSPTKQPTQKPITDSPTKKPTQQPVTDSPTKNPTPEPIAITEGSTSKQPTTNPTQEPIMLADPIEPPTDEGDEVTESGVPPPVDDGSVIVVTPVQTIAPSTQKPTRSPTDLPT